MYCCWKQRRFFWHVCLISCRVCDERCNTDALLSCLDYCNSVFHDMSRKNFDKLQCVQNHVAQIVCGVSRRQQSAWLLRHSLHWLPVTLSYKSWMTGQPDCLAAELRSYQPQLSQRSSSQELLTVPHCKTMLGRCCLS